MTFRYSNYLFFCLLCFVFAKLLYILAPPFPLQNSPSELAGSYLLDLSPQCLHRIKHNSQLLVCAVFFSQQLITFRIVTSLLGLFIYFCGVLKPRIETAPQLWPKPRSDNAGSLSCCATGELTPPRPAHPALVFINLALKQDFPNPLFTTLPQATFAGKFTAPPASCLLPPFQLVGCTPVTVSKIASSLRGKSLAVGETLFSWLKKLCSIQLFLTRRYLNFYRRRHIHMAIQITGNYSLSPPVLMVCSHLSYHHHLETVLQMEKFHYFQAVS